MTDAEIQIVIQSAVDALEETPTFEDQKEIARTVYRLYPFHCGKSDRFKCWFRKNQAKFGFVDDEED